MRDAPPQISTYQVDDGQKLAVRCWRREQPRACLVVLHGVMSHGGWYVAGGARLAAAGLDVHLLDRRGSGLNRTSQGDVRRWRVWVDDVATYLRSLPPGRPRVLMGISWGGILASAVAQSHGDLLDGLVLSCPGLYSLRGEIGSWKGALLQAANACGAGGVRLTVPLQQAELFTDSPIHQQYIRDDPFSLRRVTARFALATARLRRFALARPEEIDVSTLLLLAGRDRIVDNPRVREFFSRMPHRSNRLIEFADAGHTLEFEEDPSDYIQTLIEWCQGRGHGNHS